MTKMAEEEFAPTGLAPSLAFIVMSVVKQPGITAGDLADAMQLQPSTVTRLVDKLHRLGYLTRHSDGRFTEIKPTAKADAVNASIMKSWLNLYKRYTKILGETESASLTRMIRIASGTLD